MSITSSPSKDPETDHPLPELSVPLNCEPKDDISLPDSEDGWRSLLSCNCEALEPVAERLKCCDTMVRWSRQANPRMSDDELIDKMGLVSQ